MSMNDPRRGRFALVLLILAVLFGASTAASYYVDALWFASLGYGDVFWRTLNIQTTLFPAFAAATFAAIYGAFLALKPATFDAGGIMLVNGRPITVPVGPVLKAIAMVVAAEGARIAGRSMRSEGSTCALWCYARGAPLPAVPQAADPIFGRSLEFYLFTLPAWQLVAGWLTMLAVVACLMAFAFRVASGSGQFAIRRSRVVRESAGTRGLP